MNTPHETRGIRRWLLRVALGSTVFASAFILPFWLVVTLASVWMLFGRAYEMVFIGVVLDGLYVAAHTEYSLYTALMLCVLGVVRIVRMHVFAD